MPLEYIIEVATADFSTTQTAVAGGAHRIELCAALSDGGTTPSYGTIKKCREAFDTELFPMIRTRSGDFLYGPEEFHIMLEEVRMCRELGCDGVVVGLLRKDGSIDTDRIAKLVEAAYPMEVTFHRAFDRCRHPFEAIEALIQIGCQRLLTSGQQKTAPEGVALIAELVSVANQRIIVMPGSGVRPDNIRTLAEQTGATEFHSSLRSTLESSMEFRHASFSGEESYRNPNIDSSAVAALLKQLEGLQPRL